jgi:hypothetical protein
VQADENKEDYVHAQMKEKHHDDWEMGSSFKNDHCQQRKDRKIVLLVEIVGNQGMEASSKRSRPLESAYIR